MNPTIFSRWFIRTNKRIVDLNEWPQHATGLRLCFQHNLIGWGPNRGQRRTTLRYNLESGWTDVFQNARANRQWSPRSLDEQEGYTIVSAINGGTRPGAFKIKLAGCGIGERGLGPRLEDLPTLKERIAELYEKCQLKGILGRTRHKKSKQNDDLAALEGLVPKLIHGE